MKDNQLKTVVIGGILVLGIVLLIIRSTSSKYQEPSSMIGPTNTLPSTTTSQSTTTGYNNQTSTSQNSKTQSSTSNGSSTSVTETSEVSTVVEVPSPVIEESSVPPTPTYTHLADRDDLLVYASLYGQLASNGQPTTIHTAVEDIAVGDWPTLDGETAESSFKFWVGGGSTASPNVEEVIYNVGEFASFTVDYAYGAYSGTRCVSGAIMTAKIYVDGTLWDEVQIDDTQNSYSYTGRMFLNGASQIRIEVSTVYPTYGECIIHVQMCDSDTIY